MCCQLVALLSKAAETTVSPVLTCDTIANGSESKRISFQFRKLRVVEVDLMGSFQFNSFLLEISNQLPPDQLEKMKFLCKDKIGKKDLEKITNALKLFQMLAERGELADDNTEFLSEILKRVNRQDLSEKLDKFQSESGNTDTGPETTERAKLEIATEVIAENLGKTWRKLGRKLGLSDVKLESIQKRHPTELEETVVELLKEWRKSRGAEAVTEELLKALRACQYNLTADKVEDKLSLHGY